MITLDAPLTTRRIFRLSGDSYEIGRQHGEADRQEIQRFLADGTARLEQLSAQARKRDYFLRETRRYAEIIETVLPALASEVRGLAMGAGVHTDEAWLLQVRRELSGYRAIGPQPTSGDCSTFGRLAGEASVIGQTIDLNGAMERELTVLCIDADAKRRGVVMASFTGLLGYLGINDRGVSICQNLVLARVWRPGVPGYMAIRHLLTHAENVKEAVAMLRELPLASSRALTLCDGEQLVVVEYVHDEMRVIQRDVVTHANHFQHPDFESMDRLNPFSRTSSLRRERACQEMLGRVPVDAAIEDYLRVMDRAPLHVEPSENVQKECTVASVVMLPKARHIVVTPASMRVLAAGAGSREGRCSIRKA